MLAIRGGEVLLPDGKLHLTDVTVEAGRIVSLGQHSEGGPIIDAAGCLIVPGLIDLHTHGIHTVSAATGALEEFAAIEAQYGATTLYPTLFAPPAETIHRLKALRRETDDLQTLPQIPGLRLEAPYLAMVSGGPAASTAPISVETTDALLGAGGGCIRLWDISPELEKAPDAVRYLTDRGIVCSIAHTSASIAQARAVVDAGARLVTHLFDVFFYTPERTDPDPDVYAPCMVDYLLVEDRVTCEIIADGTHVHPLLVEKTLRCKPRDRVVFVTDSNYGAGLPPGHYSLPGAWGRVQVSGPNEGVRLVDRDMSLSGSALTPIDSFRNVIRLFGKDLATASHLWSRNPARLMGLNKGEVVAGMDADLILLDTDLNLRTTLVGGQVVYQV
jgi:N-acetylglucosamine-6-phosphate deacetylase